jgi:hypothetical protein
MSLDPVSNFAIVTVSTGYDASATSIVLTSGHGAKLPATHNYNVIWWNFSDYKNPSDDPNVEIVRVTGRTTDTLTVTRAQESTSAATHNTGAKVYKMMLGITAKMITDIDTARTIASGEVTLAMMANMATAKLIGRATAESGVPELIDLTAAGRALLDDANAAAQIATLGLDAALVSIDLNIIDLAINLETLKGAILTGVVANIFVETFQTLGDITLSHGTYDAGNKKVYL